MSVWPYVPETSLTEARASTVARKRRDREEARAADLAPDEVGPFLAALRVFDANTPAWEERLALERARAMRTERLRIEAQETQETAKIQGKGRPRGAQTPGVAAGTSDKEARRHD